MNRYVGIELHLTDHAYEQYCERVEPIKRELLRDECQKHLHNGNYGYNKGWFIHLDGVWWVYDLKESGMLLLTCYGRTTMNLPHALKWARHQNDRIDLDNLIVPGVRQDDICPADP